MKNILTCKNLSKNYGRVQALDDKEVESAIEAVINKKKQKVTKATKYQ